MNTYADKTAEEKSQTSAESLSNQQSNGESAFQFVDNRPEASAQRKIQQAINNSPQMKQLKAYQKMANNSTQVKQLRAYQAMTTSFTSQIVQQKEDLEGEMLQNKFEPTDKIQKTNEAKVPVIQAVLQGTNWNLVSQEFRQGLIHGHYRPPTNLADMHVDQATEENPHASAADMLAVLQDIYQAMVANYAASDTIGTLDWRPTGSAVVKMVGELLGEALGGKWSKYKARALKTFRKKFGQAPQGERDEMVLSKDIVPEHLAYLESLRGGDTSMTTVLPGDYRAKMQAFMTDHPEASEDELTAFRTALEAEQNQNMLEDSDAGKARFAQYKQSIESGGDTMETGGNPVSLNVQLTHTQLPAIIAVLESL